MADRVHELIEGMAASVASQLVLLANIPRSRAEKISEEVVDYVIDEFGGESFYIPRNVSGRAKKRNRQIYDEWRGDNYDELAKKYGITRQRVYAIIKEVRMAIFKEKRADLFGED